MSQQINLYQPIFRKEKIVFSARTILFLAVGLIVILGLWSVLVGQRLASLEQELARQQQAEQRAVTQVAEMRASMPPDEPDAELESRVEQLRTRRAELRESLAALEGRTPAAEVGLRDRLGALSGQVPEGLWLTAIHLADQGQSVSLSGNALEARLVPDYLSGLSSLELFSGLNFRQIRLEERPGNAPGIRFDISTEREETP